MRNALSIVKTEVFSHRNRISRAIVDVKRIRCIGGRGGDGCVAFSKHDAHHFNGPGLPFGGGGGRGGSVYAKATLNANKRLDLSSIPGTVVAGSGSSGKGNRTSGACGKDVTIELPLGTLIYKFKPQGDVSQWQTCCKNWQRELVADFDCETSESLLLAAGGAGGRGNNMKTPYNAEYGSAPQENFYEIELKSIADIGLLGLPNVGKSSLLAAMTRANSKIASYPFTTLAPVLGHIKYADGISLTVADLPGIVDCNLTQEFLRHVERTKVLCYVMDACNPLYTLEENFSILRNQVTEYGGSLAQKPFIVLVSKMDINIDKAAACTDAFFQVFQRDFKGYPLVPTSAKLGLGIDKVTSTLRDLVMMTTSSTVTR